MGFGIKQILRGTRPVASMEFVMAIAIMEAICNLNVIISISIESLIQWLNVMPKIKVS